MLLLHSGYEIHHSTQLCGHHYFNPQNYLDPQNMNMVNFPSTNISTEVNIQESKDKQFITACRIKGNGWMLAAAHFLQ